MRRITTGFLVLVAAGTAMSFAPPARSQSTQQQADRDDRLDQRARGSENGRRGGFPAPAVLTALDANRDGEISPAELTAAPQRLRELDKNQDGELSGAELRPDFGRGGGRGRGGIFGGGESRERVPPEKIQFRDGAAEIPDHATFHRLSYKGEEVMIDTFLAGLEFVKFTLDRATEDDRELYFVNTKTHRAHMMFARVAGLPFGRGGDQMKGVLVYRPMLESPRGEPGLYTFEFEPFDAYSFKMVQLCQDVLVEKMPLLDGRIGYYPRGERALAKYHEERGSYRNSSVRVYLDEDLTDTALGYLPLNPGATFGRLRLMKTAERPAPRDVVLYQSLPNELPRVAGMITEVRQTPLSHVNLRAVQDRVPNAFIKAAAENETIQPLIGKFVSYRVTADGFTIREATRQEVESYFAGRRPTKRQIPRRDLSVQTIRNLEEVRFEDSASVGVKAANLAALKSMGLPPATVPDGFAIPFYFYDEFMKHNGFYKYAATLLANPKFRQDRDAQEALLKKFRSLIKKGKMPDRMMRALAEVHKSFPPGSSIRCRSSTNNEDLPGFSGAGLYDSYTHHPDEGHFSKSMKQVFASLWNFRAFEEREFYRVDHLTTAMGVLVHLNFKGERANGVAVTDDILYQSEGNYYLNTQIGEDLVTNPEESSIPEEILLDWWESQDYQVMRSSNRAQGELLSREHRELLRMHLATIHARFARLYGKSLQDEEFAMEIEFKVTQNGELVIKQARPWVYATQ